MVKHFFRLIIFVGFIHCLLVSCNSSAPTEEEATEWDEETVKSVTENVEPTQTDSASAPDIQPASVVEELSEGTLIYSYTDTMVINKPNPISAAITLSEDLNQEVSINQLSEVIDGIPSNSPEEVPTNKKVNIRVGEWMRLTLEDASINTDTIFAIKQEQENVQYLTHDVTYWRWQVTPLRPGNHKLTLKAYIVHKDSTGLRTIPKPTNVYESKHIQITTYSFWWFDSVWRWINKYLYHIIFGVLIPAIGYALKKVFFKEKEKED